MDRRRGGGNERLPFSPRLGESSKAERILRIQLSETKLLHVHHG
jgi:hypothetical protein